MLKLTISKHFWSYSNKVENSVLLGKVLCSQRRCILVDEAVLADVQMVPGHPAESCDTNVEDPAENRESERGRHFLLACKIGTKFK